MTGIKLFKKNVIQNDEYSKTKKKNIYSKINKIFNII